MRPFIIISLCAPLLASWSANAQCFNRQTCDPSAVEIRSQLNVTLPLADQNNPADALKTVEDMRRQLATVSDREFDAMKSVFGPDTTLKSANTNSSMQDNFRGKTAFVSVQNTYQVKKGAK